MTAVETSAPSKLADHVEALYRDRRSLLMMKVALGKFRIPVCDAENLVQEVFLAFLTSGAKIEKPDGWMFAAMCNASRRYWTTHGRTEPLPEDFEDRADSRTLGLAEDLALKMSIRRAVKYVSERCQETLRLHYFEGYSASEVARLLDTTSGYAEKLIHTCLGRVREVYRKISVVTT